MYSVVHFKLSITGTREATLMTLDPLLLFTAGRGQFAREGLLPAAADSDGTGGVESLGLDCCEGTVNFMVCAISDVEGSVRLVVCHDFVQ